VREDIRDENMPRPLKIVEIWLRKKGTTVLGNPHAGKNYVDAVWRGIYTLVRHYCFES